MTKLFLQDTDIANYWVDCYPIGNGSIGIMDNQSPVANIIYLNDDTFWSGNGRAKHKINKSSPLPEIRKLVDSGNLSEAQKMIHDKLLGEWTECYLPVGKITLKHNVNSSKNYTRKLSLDTAILTSRYNVIDGIINTEEFVSNPDNVFVKKISALSSQTTTISFDSEIPFSVSYTKDGFFVLEKAPIKCLPVYHSDKDPVVYDENIQSIRLAAGVRILTDGDIKSFDNRLEVSNYKELTLIYTSSTSYKTEKFVTEVENILNKAIRLGYQKLASRHIEDYQSLFLRVELKINECETSPANTKTAIIEKDYLPLTLTLFQLGRYLTIASSREGTEAANLQGIWNHILRAPWSSNYTTNINTQMNYFGTDAVNLSELVEPLFNLVKKMRKKGELVAKETFGLEGFMLAHNSDIWGHTSPVGGLADSSAVTFGLFVGGGAWILNHLYNHFLYTDDTKFLKELVPVMENSLKFYIGYLSLNKDGYYVANPSASPENLYLYKGRPISVNCNSTMEISIFRELADNFLHAIDIISYQSNIKDDVMIRLKKLYPYKYSNFTGICEYDKPYLQVDYKHRHLSHLYGLYPGSQISQSATPDLAKAAAKTLRVRGMGGTGWSLAWKVNLFARLNNGERAYTLIKKQLHLVDSASKIVMTGGGSYPSLLCAHPPFQIDGNFGVMSGIAEMLLQSHNGYIEIFPAIPSDWKKISFHGLRARGNLTVNATMDNGNITYSIYSDTRKKIKVKVNGQISDYETYSI